MRFVVDDGDAGLRLDQLLAARVPSLSRRKARVLLEIGGVFVDRERVKVASRVLRPGQVVEAHLGGALARASGDVGRVARERDRAALPPYRIVHEDEHLIIVDKPAGLLTAPTPESDRGNLADELGRSALGPIYVVHRIDLDTSGLLVFARTEAANRALSERFRVHDVIRRYTAVVAGRVDAAMTWDAPIEDRRAVTHVEVVEPLGDAATVLACRLETGRTHQIRIHAAGAGHPIFGDRRHGRRLPAIATAVPAPPRMALHAAELGFVHPGSGEIVRFECETPADLAAWLAALRAPGLPG